MPGLGHAFTAGTWEGTVAACRRRGRLYLPGFVSRCLVTVTFVGSRLERTVVWLVSLQSMELSQIRTGASNSALLWDPGVRHMERQQWRIPTFFKKENTLNNFLGYWCSTYYSFRGVCPKRYTSLYVHVAAFHLQSQEMRWRCWLIPTQSSSEAIPLFLRLHTIFVCFSCQKTLIAIT